MKKKWILKIAIVALLLIAVVVILKLAPNYEKDKYADKINLVINNNNVTGRLKQDVYINENGVIYISLEDIENFFDGEVFLDRENNQIITTSDTKVSVISLTEKKMKTNGSDVQLLDTAIRKDGTIFLPISELEKTYNIDVVKTNNSKVITIESLDRELIKADAVKKLNVKYKTKVLSKNVDKVKQGEKVVVVSELENGWTKVRTTNGILGYVKTDKLTNKTTVREALETQQQITGKINMVWDYYSEYVSAPDRSGTTIEGINVVSPSFFSLEKGDTVKIIDNAARGGTQYIEWAKQNNYKIWAMLSNNSMQETTSTILNNYKLREELIEEVVKLAVKYNLDGVNVDFENIKMTDKDVYSRFIIELAPRLRELGMVVSVDVTAPDGSENWSLCFDRNILAKASDYLVFMAYDQYGVSSTTPGTTAGCDWVEVNVNKFLGQEAVKSEKIILGMPLYTRLWTTDTIADKVSSKVINMNKIDESLPDDVERTWDEQKKQYYVDYSSEKYRYQMWIEDETSIKEKLNLISKYNLAGGSYWEKDRETENIWTITKEALNN